MEIKSNKNRTISRVVVLRDWSLIISPFAFALLIFGLEYIYFDTVTLTAFYRSIFWFFSNTSIAKAYDSTGDLNFLYFAVYFVSMFPLYLFNVAAYVYVANKWAKIEELAKETQLIVFAAFGFTIVFIALFLLFPDAYTAHRRRPFPPDTFGIISYSFFYWAMCFFTMPAWAIGFFHLNQKFYFLKRK